MNTEFKEGYLKSSGYNIHYLIWGDFGPKLVLIHSMGMDAHGFDLFSKSIKDRYQILVLDILDHGDSDTPESLVSLAEHSEIMRDCYKQLDFEPNVLIGHSVGGMMGMILAADHPNELRGLVLVDIAPREANARRPTRPPPPDYFSDEKEAENYFKQRYPSFTSASIENRLKYALIKDVQGRLKLKPIGTAIRPSLAINLWSYVERIKVPTLLLVGSESTSITQDRAERMKNVMSNLKVVTIEGATHMIPQDKPAEFESYVLDFVESLNKD